MKDGGFTLIELILVTVLVGILAAFGSTATKRLKDSAYVAVLESDLVALSRAQEVYYAEAGGYFGENSDPDSDDGPEYTRRISRLNFQPSPGVRIRIRVSQQGWTARAEHLRRRPDRFYCALAVGEIRPYSPAEDDGVITCEPRRRRRRR